jgi:hypothetical protein
VGKSVIPSSIYACEQAYFEIAGKVNRYKRFFSLRKHDDDVAALLEREFAEIFDIAEKVKLNYERTLTYSIQAEASRETLSPGKAETYLDAQNETIEQSIESLLELDMYVGRNILPKGTKETTPEEAVEAEVARQPVAPHVPSEDWDADKDNIIKKFRAGKLSQSLD